MMINAQYYKWTFHLLVLTFILSIYSACTLANVRAVSIQSDGSSGYIVFDNVSQLQESIGRLKVGDLVKTKGYYQPGDGGSAEYIISEYQYESYSHRTSGNLTEWDQNKNQRTTNILVTNERKKHKVVPGNGKVIANLVPTSGTIDIRQFGAKPNVHFNNIKNKRYTVLPDNSYYDNSEVIQNAIDYAKANGIPRVIGWGHYWCEKQIRILPDVNFELLGGLHTNIDQPFVIIYHSFNTTHKISVYRIGGLGPENNVAKALTNSKTKDASAGVVLYNCRRVTLDVEACGFIEGLTLFGYGDGCVENTIFLRDLLNNKIGVAFESENGGWVTQSQFYGGRISSTDQNKEQLSASIAHLAPSDQHTFIGVNLEGTINTQQYSIYGGRFCAYINCRFEKSAPFNWKVNSFNKVLGGYSNRGNQIMVSKDLSFDKRDTLSGIVGSIDNTFSPGGFNISQSNMDYFDDLPHGNRKPIMNIYLNNPNAKYILGGGRWFNFPEFLVSKEGSLEYYNQGQGFDLTRFNQITLPQIKLNEEYGTNIYISFQGYNWILRKPVKSLCSGEEINTIEDLQRCFQNKIQINRSTNPSLIINQEGITHKGENLTWDRLFDVISQK